MKKFEVRHDVLVQSGDRRNESRNKESNKEAEAAAALLLAAGGSLKNDFVLGESERFLKAGQQRNCQDGHIRNVCYVSPVSSSSIGASTESPMDHQEHTGLNHFPSQLHDLLSSSELAGIAVEWLPHGRSWRVLRWEALTSEVLQKYFPQCSCDPDEFIWQLHAWGFRETRTGAERGSFQNNLFIRDSPHSCKEMRLNMQSIICKSNSSEKCLKARNEENMDNHNMSMKIKPPSVHIEVEPSHGSGNIIDAPKNGNYTPPQVIRNSYLISSQSHQSVVHQTPPNADQNVFRQRMVITPRKEVEEKDSINVHLQQRHSRNNAPYPYIVNLPETNSFSGHLSGVRPVSAGTKGLQSARGRSSRIFPSRASFPSSNSEMSTPDNHPSKIVTISTRGGRTRNKTHIVRASQNTMKHKYTQSYNLPTSTNMHNVYNIQMLSSNPTQIPIPHPPLREQHLQTQRTPTGPSNMLAIAVSRKTKKFVNTC